MAGGAGADPGAVAPAPRKKVPRELQAILEAQESLQATPRKSHKPSFAATPQRRRGGGRKPAPAAPAPAEPKPKTPRPPPRRRGAGASGGGPEPEPVGAGGSGGEASGASARDDGGSSGDEDGSGDELPALLCRRDFPEGDLRSSWLFAAVVHFCNVFRDPLNLPGGVGADKLEASLLSPAEHPVFVARLHLRLLHRDARRVIEDSEMVVWEDRVRRLWGSMW